MAFTPSAQADLDALRAAAEHAQRARAERGVRKRPKQEGLYRQVAKGLRLRHENPRHPSLQTQAFHSREHPFDPAAMVFEAFAQNRTPGAHRVFWCYGPEAGMITILAITPHP
ncbi:MAG: hypothetical protein FJW81_02865 [Actinobacteria bacterium]|nr:hypothetical protein [Actinomycetota bacterium]